MSIKICHITTAHSRNDRRIFEKECVSLANFGFDVTYLIADGLGNEIKKNVKICDVGELSDNRFLRFVIKTRKLYFHARSVNAYIYHFHDPDFIPYALKLLRHNKVVIYDVHEDVPRQILQKLYIPKLLRPTFSKIFELYENNSSKKFDFIITSTPHIRNRFLKINSNSIDICNFALIEDTIGSPEWKSRENSVCYLGGISKIRGIYELIETLKLLEFTLHLAGNFESEEVKNEIQKTDIWGKVKYYGYCGKEQIQTILGKSKVGLVLLHPTENYIHSFPIKLFEYMANGIPIIASRFPLWQNIIEKNNCGICVDPENPKEIALAIKYLLNNDDIAEEMGKNGQKAVVKRYNWEMEELKLLKLYQQVR